MSRKFGRTRYVRYDDGVKGYVLIDDGETTTLWKFYKKIPGAEGRKIMSWDIGIMYDLPEILLRTREVVGMRPTIYVEVDSAPIISECVDSLKKANKLLQKLSNGLDPLSKEYEGEMFKRKRKYLINMIRNA